MQSIGPASRSEAVLERLMLQGMNVARLNFAHGTLQGHTEDIQRIRAVASRLQRHCMIMADLPGPKIRIGKLQNEPLLLEKGNEVILTVKDLAGTPDQIPVDYKRLPESVSPGSLFFLNDGFIQLQVERVFEEEVFCRTVIGGPLLSHKGLNLPGVKILAEAVADTDLEFVAFALVGGIWLVWFLGYNFSVAVAVGFIALAGVAAETGVVMIVYLDEAWEHLRQNTAKLTLDDL